MATTKERITDMQYKEIIERMKRDGHSYDADRLERSIERHYGSVRDSVHSRYDAGDGLSFCSGARSRAEDAYEAIRSDEYRAQRQREEEDRLERQRKHEEEQRLQWKHQREEEEAYQERIRQEQEQYDLEQEAQNTGPGKAVDIADAMIKAEKEIKPI
jgi:hypothetical protein